MAITTHRARITGLVPYDAEGGAQDHIPLGPCLVEQENDRSFDIIWGADGQRSATLPRKAIAAARDNGHLVLLD